MYIKYVLLVALLAYQVSSVEIGCSCWTRACNFCRDASCGIKYDLSHGEVRIISRVLSRGYNKLTLYNSAGEELGRFGFNLRRMILDGCIQMYNHPGMEGAMNRNNQTQWFFSMSNNKVTLRVGSGWLAQEDLIGGCRRHYRDVAYFAFNGAECLRLSENHEVTGGVQFSFNEDTMEKGALYNENCDAQC